MDTPEKHWNMSRYKYHKLPEEKRALLEANEQLRYTNQEFKEVWVQTWFPDEYYSCKYYGLFARPAGVALLNGQRQKCSANYIRLLFRKGKAQLGK